MARDSRPAEPINDDYLALWHQHFGADHYAFDHGPCRFVVLNAQLINSGLDAEAEQCRWLENELAENSAKRLFVNMHYPPYLTTPDEPEHFDNIAEPGRSWFLDLMTKYDAEALFVFYAAGAGLRSRPASANFRSRATRLTRSRRPNRKTPGSSPAAAN